MAKDKGAAAAVSDAEMETAGLSAEERAALAEDDTDDADADALRALADEAGTDDEEDAGDGKDKKAPVVDKKTAAEDAEDDGESDDDEDAALAGDGKDKKAAAAEDGTTKDAAAAPAKKDAPAAAADPVEQEPAPRVLRYKAPPVEKYDEQVAALETELSDATAAFRAGDMELEDFQTKQRAVMGKRDELLKAQTKAEISAESSAQSAEYEWVQAVASFKRIAKAEGIDYAAGEVEVNGKKVKLEDQLDRTVKALANDPDNAQWTGQQFLDEAHAIIKARFGLAPTKGAADAAAAAALKKKAKEEGDKRKPDTSGVPKTLGGLPAAEEDDAGGDPEFGHLDKLDGLDLEVAVARMTPDQQDRWSRQA